MLFTGDMSKNNFMMNFREERKKIKRSGGFENSANGRQIFDILPKPSALG